MIMAKREMKTQKVEEPIIEETIVEETVVEEPVVEEVVETVAKPISVGVVTGCSKLNIRKKANSNGDVLTVVNAKTELTIDPDYSNKEWFKVTLKDGTVGYCMKKFVTIK
jgi:uncharacterized protein YgiM (DUF1202 family)